MNLRVDYEELPALKLVDAKLPKLGLIDEFAPNPPVLPENELPKVLLPPPKGVFVGFQAELLVPLKFQKVNNFKNIRLQIRRS